MYEKKSNFKLILALIIVISIVVFFLIDSRVEQNKPIILLEKKLTYWNTMVPIKINFSDENNIKSYEVIFFDGQKNYVLAKSKNNESLGNNVNITTTGVENIDLFKNFTNAYIKIKVRDSSKWNFLQGNENIKIINIKIDTKNPIAEVLSHSSHIKRGGSALAIVKVFDENLDDAYILLNNKDRFELYPYKKENYFISFLAWDVKNKDFTSARLIIIDKAGNKISRKIPLWVQEFVYKKKHFTIKNDFIEQVSMRVLEHSRFKVPNNLKDIFLAQNIVLRKKNYESLKKIIKKYSNKKLVKKYTIKTFKRLKGSTKVSDFPDLRTYYYNKKEIDKQWHLGIDWVAFVKNRVISSNDGKVIFNGDLGIYGNTILIDHNFAITSLYAHLSSTSVEKGDIINAGNKIGNTGRTGAAFGDHLHFSILVQGIMVDPKEWLDRTWIKERFLNVLKRADKIIKKSKK